MLPEGLIQRKIQMTHSGNEPAPFWIVAQYLDQMSEDIIKFVLLQTNFMISTNVLCAYFIVFYNPSLFLYALWMFSNSLKMISIDRRMSEL